MNNDDLINRLPQGARSKFNSTDYTSAQLQHRFGDVSHFETEEGASRLTGASPLGKRLVDHAKKAERTWLAVREAHFRSLGDRSVDPTQAFLRSARNAKRQLKDMSMDFDSLMDDVEDEGTRLTQLKAAALKPPANIGEAMVDSEVRALIRAESDPSRQAELARAHPRAVATAPALAAGVADSLRDSIADAYLRATVPDVMAQSDDLAVSVEMFGRASAALDKETKGIIDFALADSLQAGGEWQPSAAEAA